MTNDHISQAALEDWESIWLYTLKTWSRRQAAIYHKDIVDEIKVIAKSDQKYGIKYFDIMEGLYCRRCHKLLIFYRFGKDGHIDIIRILHAMMDIESKF